MLYRTSFVVLLATNVLGRVMSKHSCTHPPFFFSQSLIPLCSYQYLTRVREDSESIVQPVKPCSALNTWWHVTPLQPSIRNTRNGVSSTILHI